MNEDVNLEASELYVREDRYMLKVAVITIESPLNKSIKIA